MSDSLAGGANSKRQSFFQCLSSATKRRVVLASIDLIILSATL